MSLLRSVGAVVLGFLVALALVIGIELASNAVYPFPADADPTDMELMMNHVRGIPPWLLAVGAVGWAVTTFVGAWVATRLGTDRHAAHGIVLGSLLFVAAAFNMLSLPYPVWFEIASVILIPLAAFAGIRLAGRRQVLAAAD